MFTLTSSIHCFPQPNKFLFQKTTVLKITLTLKLRKSQDCCYS